MADLSSADVAIVGNGVAGYFCAARLARDGLRPLLIGPGLPHDRPQLTKAALRVGAARSFGDEQALAKRGIALLDGIVEDADFERHRLAVRVGDEIAQINAPVFVLAAGLAYPSVSVPGLEASHVNTTPAGLRRLSAALDSGRKRVLVIGAGLIGVETAATLAGAGHAVTIVDVQPRALHRLHDPLPRLAASALGSLGARFIGEVRIRYAESPAGVTRVTTEAHGVLEADVVISATGGRPRLLPGLVEAPVEVDGAMRVSGYDHVYAIGDCAVPWHARFGSLRFPHWDAAVGSAERAAEAIAGVERVYDRLPYWWSDVGPLRFDEIGVASEKCEWTESDGFHVGRDEVGKAVSVLAVNAPRRLEAARQLIMKTVSA